MDRTRIATVVAGLVTLAVSVFALAMAVSSGDGAEEAAPAQITPEGTGDPAAAVEATGTLEIEIVDFVFDPQHPEIEVGTEVTWINLDSTGHFILPSGGSFETSPNLDQGDTWSFVFTEPGTYDYICGNHPATMAGSITVVEG